MPPSPVLSTPLPRAQEKASWDGLRAQKAERRLQEVVRRRRAQEEQRRSQQEPLESETGTAEEDKEEALRRRSLSEEPRWVRAGFAARAPAEAAVLAARSHRSSGAGLRA